MGCRIELHDDHFAQNAKDVDWLKVIGRSGWVLLTKDERIRTNQIEQQALADHSVTAFLLSRQDLTAQDMVDAFTTALPRMRNLLSSRRRPFVARVSPAGTVVVLKDVLRVKSGYKKKR